MPITACTGTVATIDRRSDTLDRHPVWEKKITYACTGTDETATITLPINGILQKVIYKRPSLTNSDQTSELTIADRNDVTVFTSGSGLAHNDISVYNLSEPLVGACKVLITFDEAIDDSAASFTVTLRGV